MSLYEPDFRREVSRFLPIGNGDRKRLARLVDAAIRHASEIGIGQVVGNLYVE